MTIPYRKVDWKYVLTDDYEHIFTARFFFGKGFRIKPYQGDHYTVTLNGILFEAGFGWDGPSGPTVDTENSMRAALVHDALYRAIWSTGSRNYRRRADREFRRILKEDGMSMLRRWLWWIGVRCFGGAHMKRYTVRDIAGTQGATFGSAAS